MNELRKYSPGPWRWVHETCRGNQGGITDANGDLVCHFGDDITYYPSAGEGPMPADQGLILAAPDMFEALLRIQHVTAEGFTFCPACQYVQEAGHALDCFVGNAITKAKYTGL